jgi:exopolysaccharide biosynthesis predicted pyruvyltransferase EpsI
LLDFPNYGNPGDSAIWLGALACLRALGYSRPIYTSDHRTFDERMLRAALSGGGTILLPGGGNLGDLWPQAQVFRERVLRAFPEHAIVQLSQTIHFSEPEALARARVTLGAHPDFTVLVRDVRSLEIATMELGCRASLCPDLALCLTAETEPALRVEPARESRVDTLPLLRTDHEGMHHAEHDSWGPGATGSVDWVTDVSSPLNRIAKLGEIVVRTSGRARAPSIAARLARLFLSACYPALARERLRRGCQLLRSARVVVTDRLHGHVLGLLLGLPHVVLGDRNGKLRGFIDAWTSSASLLRWADTRREADILASELLSRVGSSSR